MSNTRNCLREFIKYNLSIRNFTVTNQGNYLKAIKGKEKYRILPVTRTIPIESETTTVEANYETVKKFQKYNKCKLNKNIFGIPQGNSLSGVLANIYAIDFDRSLAELSKEFDGFYQRYSDDFIIVLDVENMTFIIALSAFTLFSATPFTVILL